VIRLKIIRRGLRAAVSVTYTAVLEVSEDSVRFLSSLLARERVRRSTRKDSRSLSTDQQAVLVLRWLFDDTRMTQLARDKTTSACRPPTTTAKRRHTTPSTARCALGERAPPDPRRPARSGAAAPDAQSARRAGRRYQLVDRLASCAGMSFGMTSSVRTGRGAPSVP